jgi:P4 family phage/plasmid primase-like protien
MTSNPNNAMIEAESARWQADMVLHDADAPATISRNKSLSVAYTAGDILNGSLGRGDLADIRNRVFKTVQMKDGDSYLDDTDKGFQHKEMVKFLIEVMDIRVFHSRERPDIPPTVMMKVGGRYAPVDNIIPGIVIYLTDAAAKEKSCNDVLFAIKHSAAVKCYLEDLPQNRRKANFNNGIVDISGDEIQLLPHNDDDIFFARTPRDYEPGHECPAFHEFLEYALDTKYHTFIFEWIGYCLFETYEFQNIIFHHGVQASGKSTLLNLVSTILGPANVSGLSLKEMAHEKFKLGALMGKLANHGSEASYKDLKDGAEILKRLSSGIDPIMFERKYKDALASINTAKLTFAMNKLPRTFEDDGGIDRRLLLVGWSKIMPLGVGRKFNDMVSGMFSPDELLGVTCEAIAAFHAMVHKDVPMFSYAPATDDTHVEYKNTSDDLAEFLYDRVTMQDTFRTDRGDVAFATYEDLYVEYQIWCAENGICGRERKRFVSSTGVSKALFDKYHIHTAAPRWVGGKTQRGFEFIEISAAVNQTML